jgi:hypothetical protein
MSVRILARDDIHCRPVRYIVKKGSKYVHSFHNEGVPCKTNVDDWTRKQTFAFRWQDRNGACAVAFDIRGHVVSLLPKKKCPRCHDDGSPCSMCGAADQPKAPCDPVTGAELDS